MPDCPSVERREVVLSPGVTLQLPAGSGAELGPGAVHRFEGLAHIRQDCCIASAFGRLFPLYRQWEFCGVYFITVHHFF